MMDTALTDFLQIFCKLKGITLEPIPMREWMSLEESSSTLTGQGLVGKQAQAHITFEESHFIGKAVMTLPLLSVTTFKVFAGVP